MRKFVIPVSAVLMVALGAWLTSSCARTQRVLAAASDVPTVAVARTTTENLSHDLILTAEFRPFQEVDVMAKVAGYIKRINVDVGDRVKLGDPLATLEIPEMADDQRRASAALERAQSEVARAGDELQRAESAHEIVHLSLQRLAAVAEKRPGLIAQQEIDDARSKDLVAEAQVASAKSGLAAATDQVHVNTADLERVRTMLDYTRVTAPFAEWLALAVIAWRVPGKLQWDSRTMRFTNSAEATRFVKPEMRKGWELKL